jgi:protein ImuA
VADRAIIEALQKQIQNLHNRRTEGQPSLSLGLGPMEAAFPCKVFPRGAVHELISHSAEDAASTAGFMAVVLSKLLKSNGCCLWIGPHRIFPPALKNFGVEPDRILFVNTLKPKDTLWALEEAMKCEALTAVVGELCELGFQESRRLQLAVERSQVTAFIHRHRPKAENAVTCVSRWKITSLESVNPGNLPGVGFPCWNVALLKVRNGKPGEWQVQWSPKGLEYNKAQDEISVGSTLKTGSHGF